MCPPNSFREHSGVGGSPRGGGGFGARDPVARREAAKFTQTGTRANLNKEWPVNYWLVSDIGFPRLGENGGTRESPTRGLLDPWPNYAFIAFYFSPVPGSERGPPETLINTARELSYKLSAWRTCKRRESDERGGDGGFSPFNPPRRANASFERDGNEIACCVPNSFSLSHRLALRAAACNSPTYHSAAERQIKNDEV